MNTRRSIAENLAIAIKQACWSRDEIAAAAQSVFRKQQTWLQPFATDLRGQFIDAPPFEKLLPAITANSHFRQASLQRKTQKDHRQAAFRFEHTYWLNWALPRFNDLCALASHLGIRGTTLHWLTCLHRGPDDRPEHYARRWIKKSNGRLRLLESPKSQLKTVQRIILQDLLNRIPLHQAAHGFRRNRSVITFAKPHLNQHCCLRMDLQDFFPNIRAGRVRGFFRSLGYATEVARALTALATTQTPLPIVESKRPRGCRGTCELSQLYLPGHLPQGAPTSPALANALAFRLDARLAGLAKSAGAKYTRYADDLLFSGGISFAKGAKRFASTVASIALDENFNVNFHKTRIQHRSQQQRATGIVLNRHANVPRQDFDQLKAILHNCVRHGPTSQNRDGVANFRQHLLGRINWVMQLNPTRAQKLQTIFAAINWN